MYYRMKETSVTNFSNFKFATIECSRGRSEGGRGKGPHALPPFGTKQVLKRGDLPCA